MTGSTTRPQGTHEEIRSVAEQGYIFAYPLVLADVTRQVMTYAPRAEGQKAPLGQFAHYTSFPDPTYTDVVSPNADTFYSLAFLDLSGGPIILSVPDMGGRYYLMSLHDLWTDVFHSIGSRTTGYIGGHFAIVGPGWEGGLPMGVREIRAPTEIIAIAGRTRVDSKADAALVRAVQEKYKLTPLGAWGRTYYTPAEVPVDPAVDGKTAPVEQVDRMEAAGFFARVSTLMKGNPPHPADSGMVSKLERIGLVPGQDFEIARLDPSQTVAIETGFVTGRGKVIQASKHLKGHSANGWDFPSPIGSYGTDYLQRAAGAAVGLGASVPEDCLYARCRAGSDGQQLRGEERYVLHFPDGQTPPVNAFWSLTMYNSHYYFVANPIRRYAIGSRDPLKLNSDGSLDIYIQYYSPGEELESNWLPAPRDDFNVMLRLYWPKHRALDGNWQPPGIQRVG
jgi:hypothetical protein